MPAPRILAFSGSLRVESLNQRILLIAAEGASAAGAAVEVIKLKDFDLPLYDGDQEAASGLPAGAVALKERMKAAQGFLIASPEHNSTYSAALKNALDWASRSLPGEPSFACFKNKAAALVSASPGALGGLRGLPQLATLLRNIQMIVLPNQRAISAAHEAFLEDGSMKDRSAAEGLRAVGADLAKFLAMTPAG
ncbi:MAG: NAD(P)H-dependent oxidoreductase [Kiritimatiellia bacterium]